MQRAGTVIAKWKSGGHCVALEDVAPAAWRAAVGPRIAAHTAGINLVRKHLIVQVDDEIWRRQLWALRRQIVDQLAKVLGAGIVEDLELRLAPLRRGPGREELPARKQPQRAAARDEAEQIADPVLRTIYRQARKKASA